MFKLFKMLMKVIYETIVDYLTFDEEKRIDRQQDVQIRLGIARQKLRRAIEKKKAEQRDSVR